MKNTHHTLPFALSLLLAVVLVLGGAGIATQPTLAGPAYGEGEAVAAERLMNAEPVVAGFSPAALAAGKTSRLRDQGFATFAASLNKMSGDAPVGLYAPGLLAAPIVAQPAGNPAYVSPADGVLTHFGLTAGHGSTGLLAHNTAAGVLFSRLQPGQVIYLVRGNQDVDAYLITTLLQYQALQPSSPYSDFIDLEQPSLRLTATELFYQVYAVPGRLVLQTCIAKDGNDNWGRLFLIAEPVEPGYQATRILEAHRN
jgi:hypothetical protein